MLKVKKYWHHLLYPDIISFFVNIVKKPEKMMKMVNIEGENLYIF